MKRLSLTATGLAGDSLEIPYARIEGAADGPHLTVVAGVHGCEYTAQAAVMRLINELDEAQLSGTVTAVPILNQPGFWARAPFVVPVDDKNLNRCFPGDPNGTYTEALAHAIFTNFIQPADYLLDLHAGDVPEGLEPFCIYEESPVAEKARELALVYGTGHIVRQSRDGRTVGGTTSAAAADIGIPAIVAEWGANGICDEASVAAHTQGVTNVLAHLGMVPAELARPAAVPAEHDGWIWLRAAVRGWWQPWIEVGQQASAGDVLGVMLDPFGAELERIVAPAAGCPMFITTSPAVLADGLLLGLAKVE
ncbi:MAG: M14 family metallopeptidase [Actinomycetia bacterium]|nr:M14 family metallopeptidase [Actinomycetes bacterium]